MSRTAEIHEHLQGWFYHTSSLIHLTQIDDDELVDILNKYADQFTEEMVTKWAAKGMLWKRVADKFALNQIQEIAHAGTELLVEKLK